jgi:hypothetical protein
MLLLSFIVMPGEARDSAPREGDPGGMTGPGLPTWVPFPSRRDAALGRE